MEKRPAGASLILVPEHVGGVDLYADAVLDEPQRLSFVNHLIQQAVGILFPFGLLFLEFFG